MKGVTMTCDCPGCKNEVAWAPRIYIPSRTPFAAGNDPIRVMTTLHSCDLHRGSFRIEDILDGKLKRKVELQANRVRVIGFKPDFEAAKLEYVRVTTPEYRAFLGSIVVNANPGSVYV